MDCSVVVEAAVPVYDVSTPDEAVRIAISKTGEMLNPDLSYVEIDVRPRACSHCGEPRDPAFVAADEALVGLALEMVVFNVEREEHASRIARKEIGQRLDDIPLAVLEVEVIEEAAGVESDEVDDPGAAVDDPVAIDDSSTDGDDTATDSDDSGTDGDDSATDDDDGDLLPEFDDLLE